MTQVIDQVLQGFACTLFAYGQTGSGKTHTMEGDLEWLSHRSSEEKELDERAGIVPRAITALFQATGRDDTTIRISHVQIYNEELSDLLADTPQNLRLLSERRPDGAESSVIVGLEEKLVNSPQEAFALLLKSSRKRIVAETNMNHVSSRSHCIFTITVTKRETVTDGSPDEAPIRIGRLHLVDLAGAENVGRSGAVGLRGREAGNINQSLSALGRVINALVEHRGHIPYRDSKLTRILQESLGGSALTTIVATVTPSHTSIEESISTLEYATRARKISNKPRVTRKASDAARVKQLSAEVARLRSLLQAARDHNGMFVPQDEFKQMENAQKQLSRIELLLQAKQDELSRLAYDLKMTQENKQAMEEEIERQAQELSQARAAALEAQRKFEAESLVAADRLSCAERARAAAQQLQGLLNQRQNELKRITERLTSRAEEQSRTAETMRVYAASVEERANSIAQDAQDIKATLDDAQAAVSDSLVMLNEVVSEKLATLSSRARDHQRFVSEMNAIDIEPVMTHIENTRLLSEGAQAQIQSVQDKVQQRGSQVVASLSGVVHTQVEAQEKLVVASHMRHEALDYGLQTMATLVERIVDLAVTALDQQRVVYETALSTMETELSRSQEKLAEVMTSAKARVMTRITELLDQELGATQSDVFFPLQTAVQSLKGAAADAEAVSKIHESHVAVCELSTQLVKESAAADVASMESVAALTSTVTEAVNNSTAAAASIVRSDDFDSMPFADITREAVEARVKLIQLKENHQASIEEITKGATSLSSAATECTGELVASVDHCVQAVSDTLKFLHSEAADGVQAVTDGAFALLQQSKEIPTQVMPTGSPISLPNSPQQVPQVPSPPRDRETLLSTFIEKFGSPSRIPAYLAELESNSQSLVTPPVLDSPQVPVNAATSPTAISP